MLRHVCWCVVSKCVRHVTITNMKTLVLNWKMNPPTYAEARGLFEETKRIALSLRGVRLVVAPPAVFLYTLAHSYKGKKIICAGQDTAVESIGAYTGSISALQLKESGASAVIVGHSECRARGDTDQVVARKVQAALAAKLQPIICVGESARDKDGNYITVVRSQVSAALKDVPTTKLKDITIAYEPVYAIGAAQPPHDHDIHEMMIVIKKELVRLYGDTASKISCIYGGAVFAHTARAILAIPDVSGFIVGRASLNPEEVSDILKSF